MIQRTYAVTVAVADHDQDLLDRVVPAAIRDRLDYTAAEVMAIEVVTNEEVAGSPAPASAPEALELVPATPGGLAEAVRATEAARDAEATATAAS